MTSADAEERLRIFGPNKLEEKEVVYVSQFLPSSHTLELWYRGCNFVITFNITFVSFIWDYLLQESKFLKFLGFMHNPLSWVMEAAAIMAIALANGGVSPLALQLACLVLLDNAPFLVEIILSVSGCDFKSVLNFRRFFNLFNRLVMISDKVWLFL